jgi:SAM-dependent methyltransferase
MSGDQDPAARTDATVQARWGGGEFVEELEDAFWMNPRRVRAYLNRLATGSAHCDWLTWFKAHWFPPAPDGATRRCLVLGCGDGWLERALVADRPDLRVDACDIAPGAVARARETARALGIDALDYSVLDLDREDLPAGRYDLVVAHSVLHHVAELEHAFDQIEASLRPGGLMVVHEFVGPCHLQYTDAALEVIDALMAALPERYRRSSSTGEVLRSKPRPDLGYLLRVDPSEGVRADELDGFVRSRFDLRYEADLCGTVLQHLLWQIAHNFRDGDGFDETVLGVLCAVEESLVAGGALDSDYRLYVVTRRGDDVPLPPRAQRLADPFPPRSTPAPAAGAAGWRALPCARAYLHEVATGSPECDWATLALDRLRALGVGAADPVLVVGDSWLTPVVRERFPKATLVERESALRWMLPRRFAAVVTMEALASRRPEELDAALRRLRRRLRPGGVLLACERLAPTERNRRLLDRLTAATTPLGSAAPFVSGPERPAVPRDLRERCARLGLEGEALSSGGELLEPLLDGSEWADRGYPPDRIGELVCLFTTAERLLRRFGVLDDANQVLVLRAGRSAVPAPGA